MPGGIEIAILEPKWAPHVMGPLISPPESNVAAWALFLVLAYFVGHLIFQVGSYIDYFYNFIRERINPYGNESAYQCATRIKDSMIYDNEREALNTFQWA